MIDPGFSPGYQSHSKPQPTTVPKYLYTLSGLVGVLHPQTHEVYVEYEDFEVTYSTESEYQVNNFDHFSFLCAYFLARYTTHLFVSGEADQLLGKQWGVDAMSFGFSKIR